MKTAIHWFRRDLRVTDNTALAAAVAEADEVVPVYVQSGWTSAHRWTGANRQAFLCGCLESLDGNLRAAGGRLLVRRGDSVGELVGLAKECGARAIYFNRDPDPHGRATEAALAAAAAPEGIEARGFKDVCIHERDEVMTGQGSPYRVFTPYSKAWRALPKPTPLGKIRAIRVPAAARGTDIPKLSDWGLGDPARIVEPGERAARDRLKKFLASGIARYQADRNTPAGTTTSRISQDLRFGLLSVREIYARCAELSAAAPAAARAGIETFINELVWREFYMSVLWHWPGVLESEFNEKFRGMQWPGTEDNFRRWCAGETGFPVVDAAMRQLEQTGFMHNRTRMIAAMFLTKDLHVDWRRGEQFFMEKLVDGEIASNNGGWQWSAGTGADAAPYFRIQNPWTQTARYDPDGEYIREWVQELRNVPAKALQAPPRDGKRLAPGYPAPIVDHAEARERTLDLFAAHAGPPDTAA